MQELVSLFSQGIRPVELRKRHFTIVAADRHTVATNPTTGNQMTYHPKSHPKSLADWKGKPVIINHGIGKTTPVGEVVSADIAEEGLILSFKINDDRMLELLEKNSYEGFSIGTMVDFTDSTSFSDSEILSYHPHELSVIMYPERPACPKGVCDIISMMQSCNHEIKEENNEVKTMAEETKLESSPPCDCKGKGIEMVSAEYKIQLSSKDEEINKLKTQIATLEADVKSKSELISSHETKLAEIENAEKQSLISSLPENIGIDYTKLNVTELRNLTKFHSSIKTENAGATETPTPSAEEQKKSAAKPWIDSHYKPGGY